MQASLKVAVFLNPPSSSKAVRMNSIAALDAKSCNRGEIPHTGFISCGYTAPA